MASSEFLHSRSREDGLDGQIDLIESALSRSARSLKFPNALEGDFLAAFADKRLTLITLAAFAAVLLFGSLIAADWWVTPDILMLGAALRMLMFPALVLPCLLLLRWWRQPWLNEWGVAAASLLALALHAVPAVLSHHPLAVLRLVEINLIVVFTCAVARFWPAALTCAGAVLTHAGMALLLDDASGVLKLCLSVLLGASLVFALYATFTLERDERIAYLMARREALLDQALQLEHDRMALLATQDALTGVANRRSFEAYFDDSLKRACEQGLWLSVLMIDVDHFKQYNDHHGHQAGDRCLQSVAQVVGACLRRPVDMLARLGGEEFAVIMPDADQAAASLVAERIRHAVQSQNLLHLGATAAPVVTISLGVCAELVGLQTQAACMLQRADQALYQSKAQGRNRVSMLDAVSS